MTNVVPVDEFISDSWYPGYTPARDDAGVYTEALSTFRKEDEQRFWLLDFHYPRGMVPLGVRVSRGRHLLLHPAGGRGTAPADQRRARASRMAGPHIYTSEVPVTSPWAIGERVERVQRALPDILGRFEQTWADRIGELNRGLAYFEGQSYDGRDIARPGPPVRGGGHLPPSCVDDPLRDHVSPAGHVRRLPRHLSGTGHRRGGDREVPAGVRLQDHGDRPGPVGADPQGSRGRAWLHCSTPPTRPTSASTLRATPAAGGWLAEFDAFLQTYGHRTEGIADVVLTPWIDDPVSPLGTIKTYLQKGADHDFEKARDRGDGGAGTGH